MKKFVLSLAGMLLLTAAQATPVTGRIIARDADGHYFHIDYESSESQESKVFDGKTYTQVSTKALYVIQSDYMGLTDYMSQTGLSHFSGPRLYIRREKSGKTFRYDVETGQEELFIDPTLNVGDEFMRSDGVILRVTDATEEAGVRILQLSDKDANVTDVWRSDIGSVHSGIIPRDAFPDLTLKYVAYDLEHGYIASLNEEDVKAVACDYKPTNQRCEDFFMFDMDGNKGQLEYFMQDGMLHVKGLYVGSEDYPNYVECLADGNTLYLNFDMVKDDAKCGEYLSEIDLHFGPFEPGVYTMFSNYTKPIRTSIAYKPNQPEYRLFVEKGKTWKVGWFPSDATENVAQQIHIYTLEGDTLVDGQKCMKLMHEMMCSPDYPLDDGSLSRKEYAGALYEKDKEVFCALPHTENFVKLYAFIPFLEDDDQYSILYQKYMMVERFWKQYIATDTYKGNAIGFRTLRSGELKSEYMLEGIGTEMGPLSGADAELLRQAGYRLMQCNVYDEILYDDPTLTDGVNQEEELAKRRIDFTHVTKPVLKAPRRAADGQEESVSGGYTPSELTIDTEMLSDTYQVVIKEKGITPIYTTTICGSQTLSLSIDINRWIAPFYTISLEGSTDHFMATFSPEDYVTAINEIFPGTDSDATSSNVPSTKKGIYDLQGRRLDCEPQHGVFIRDGRKVVK